MSAVIVTRSISISSSVDLASYASHAPPPSPIAPHAKMYMLSALRKARRSCCCAARSSACPGSIPRSEESLAGSTRADPSQSAKGHPFRRLGSSEVSGGRSCARSICAAAGSWCALAQSRQTSEAPWIALIRTLRMFTRRRSRVSTRRSSSFRSSGCRCMEGSFSGVSCPDVPSIPTSNLPSRGRVARSALPKMYEQATICWGSLMPSGGRRRRAVPSWTSDPGASCNESCDAVRWVLQLATAPVRGSPPRAASAQPLDSLVGKSSVGCRDLPSSTRCCWLSCVSFHREIRAASHSRC